MPEYQPEPPSNEPPPEDIDYIDISDSDKARLIFHALLDSVENVVAAAFDPKSPRDLYAELESMKLALVRYKERERLDMEM